MLHGLDWAHEELEAADKARGGFMAFTVQLRPDCNTPAVSA
jgi:hypothetical protein